MALKEADAVMVFFDINNKESFEECKGFVYDIDEFGRKAVLKYLIANKMDLLINPIEMESFIKFAKFNKMEFLKLSAKKTSDVNKCLEVIIATLFKNL